MKSWGDFGWGFVAGILIALISVASAIDGYSDRSFEVVEDNAVETIVSMQENDKTTLITINRYEDGLWITEYDGRGEPETTRVD